MLYIEQIQQTQDLEVTVSEIPMTVVSETLILMVVSEMEIQEDSEMVIQEDLEMETPVVSDLVMQVDSVILILKQDRITNNHNQDIIMVVSDLMIQEVLDPAVDLIPAAVAASDLVVHQVEAVASDPADLGNLKINKNY